MPPGSGVYGREIWRPHGQDLCYRPKKPPRSEWPVPGTTLVCYPRRMEGWHGSAEHVCNQRLPANCRRSSASCDGICLRICLVDLARVGRARSPPHHAASSPNPVRTIYRFGRSRSLCGRTAPTRDGPGGVFPGSTGLRAPSTLTWRLFSASPPRHISSSVLRCVEPAASISNITELASPDFYLRRVADISASGHARPRCPKDGTEAPTGRTAATFSYSTFAQTAAEYTPGAAPSCRRRSRCHATYAWSAASTATPVPPTTRAAGGGVESGHGELTSTVCTRQQLFRSSGASPLAELPSQYSQTLRAVHDTGGQPKPQSRYQPRSNRAATALRLDLGTSRCSRGATSASAPQSVRAQDPCAPATRLQDRASRLAT